MSTDTKTLVHMENMSGYLTSGTEHLLDALAKSMSYKDHTVLSAYQLGWRKSSSYSGDTHGEDCFDLYENDWQIKVKHLRLLGGIVYHRTIADGGGSWTVAHVHGGRRGCTAITAALKGQFTAYDNDRNGLVSNLKDRDWRPRYQITFVDDGVHERWIATKTAQGYSQPGGHSDDKSGAAHAKGYVTGNENIATVKVNGVEYLVFASMVFFRKADFNVYTAGFVAKAEKWTMKPSPSSATIYGRTAPGPDAPKKKGSVYPKATGHGVTSIGYVTIKGVKYVSTANGTWFTATSLELVKPTAPAPAKSFAETVVTQNVIGNRLSPKQPSGISDWKKGEAYNDRVPLMMKLVDGNGQHIVCTQEAGTAAMAETFADALAGSWDHYRGGDNFQGGDITQTINWATARYKKLASGTVVVTPSGPGHSHDDIPWVNLEHLETGIELYVADIHAIAGASSANDKARETAMGNTIVALEKIANGLPILFVGDWNSYLEQAYDGPGRALKAHGYLDAELSPCAGVNTSFDSYNGLHNPPYKRSRQLDRMAAKPTLIRFDKREVLLNLDAKGNHVTPWPADHQPLLTDITVYRTK